MLVEVCGETRKPKELIHVVRVEGLYAAFVTTAT